MVAFAELTPDGIRTFTVDVLSVVDGLPRALVDGLVGMVQLTATVVPIIAGVYLIVRRRYLLLSLCLLAAAIAALTMLALGGFIEESIPIDELGFDRVDSWFIGSQYPSSAYLAALTAALVAASPWLARAWRRSGWVLVLASVVARALTATEVPLRNALLLAIGAAAGSAALLIVGAPRRRLDPATIRYALWQSGLDVGDLTPDESLVAGERFVGTGPSGAAMMVVARGRDQRDTDLLLHLWRQLTVKGLTSEMMLSPHRSVEHEALAMGLFGAAGARTPTPLAVVDMPDEAVILATAFGGGVRMTDLETAPPLEAEADERALTDAALADLWGQVAILQHRRFAHRSLNAASVLVEGDRCTLIDLDLADVAATDEILGADVAELLASTACIIGVEPAVDHAVGALSADQLARAVPLIQRAVLTSTTRAAVKRVENRDDRDKDSLLDDLRDRLADAIGLEQVQIAPVQRITIKGTVALVGSLVLAAYVFALASNWDAIWEAFTTADLAYVPPIIVLMITTYLTGSWSLMGATTVELSFTKTTEVMFGQSFLNRFTPANAGGMAMRMRYLQLNGLDATVAGATVGLTSAASGIAQGVMIAVFFIWGGAADRFSDFSFPDLGTVLIIIVAIGMVCWFILVTTWGRTVLRPWVADAFGRVRGSFGEVLTSPRQLTRLMGGALLGKLANIIAFWLSVLAFDVTMSLPKAGAIYMIATTIGAAVPTPGGVGGIEAALTAALISFGVDNATAAAIVMLFRTLTFWLPTLPGYFFMRYTQRAGIV